MSERELTWHARIPGFHPQHCMNWAWWGVPVIPKLQSREKTTPGTPWPVSTAGLVSSRLVRDLVSK